MNTPRLALSLAAVIWLAATGAAQADVLHGPGTASMVGYSKPLRPKVALRADLAALSGTGRESIDQGVASIAAVQSDRAAVVMDWALVRALRTRHTARQRDCCD